MQIVTCYHGTDKVDIVNQVVNKKARCGPGRAALLEGTVSAFDRVPVSNRFRRVWQGRKRERRAIGKRIEPQWNRAAGAVGERRRGGGAAGP